MHDDDTCPNCSRKDREILSLKADLIRERDGRTLDKVRTALLEAARKAGVLPAAEEDAVARALALGKWEIDKKGQIVLTEGGLTAISRRGDSNVTPAVAFRDMKPDAPHLYSDCEETKKTGDTGPNPWAKDSWNMTSQGQIVLKDPAQAKRLAANAGITLSV